MRYELYDVSGCGEEMIYSDDNLEMIYAFVEDDTTYRLYNKNDFRIYDNEYDEYIDF